MSGLSPRAPERTEAEIVKWVGLIVLLVLLTASPAVSQVADDKLVVPGARIGNWTLGMSIQDVVRVNGRANARPSIVSVFIPKMVWHSWDSLSLAVATHDQRKVEYLAVYQSRGYTTSKGIGYSSAKQAVFTAYGQPTVEGDIFVLGRIVPVLAYDTLGLAFFLDDDAVQVILIFRPGESGDLISTCGG